MRKRILNIMLCCVMLVGGVMPTTAFAESGSSANTGKAIQLGISGITGYDSTNGYDYVYYGTWNNESIKWRVLDNKTNTGGSGFFMLSDVLLGDISFDNTSPYSNVWQGSDAQSWCKRFYNTNLTVQEQDAVLATTKSDEEFTSSTKQFQFAASEKILDNDKVFFLSAKEAENDNYGFANDAARIANYGVGEGEWYLRSPSREYTNYASAVDNYGAVIRGYVNNVRVARPAFNLNTSSVLLTSAATDGKTDANLTAVNAYNGNEWKLTIKDSSRSFSANVNGQASASAPVGGSVQIIYSGAQTGENEYVSAMLCDSNNNVLYYGNIAQSSASGTATVNIPSGLAMGSYNLKVFSEQCNGDKKTDYASDFQNIALKVLPRGQTPNFVFTATSDNSGTLSDVDTSMKYSVDGGASWNNITGETMNITGVTARNGVKVYKSGDGTTTADSEVQTIDVTQAAQPTGIDKTDCTTSQQDNGQITGVDTTMEYKLSTAFDWTTIDANIVTGLTDGSYEVRVKAKGTVLASNPTTVSIGAHTCVAQGDWWYNGTSHWKFCACGAKVGEAVHSGGTATCTEQATCSTCGEKYGAVDPNNHTDATEWIQTSTMHTLKCKSCDATVIAKEPHEWVNGACSECGYKPTYRPTVQKPEINVIGSGKVTLSTDGRTADITADEGYELVSITVNGKEVANTDKLTGLKTGDKVVVTFQKKSEEPTVDTKTIADKVGKMQTTARSSKTAKKNIRITVNTDRETNNLIKEIKDLGYTVKYKYYRSTKKASKYTAKVEKDADINSYINTSGKKGTKYYYKVRVMVYDADGSLVAKSDLKQCKYAARTWSK